MIPPRPDAPALVVQDRLEREHASRHGDAARPSFSKLGRAAVGLAGGVLFVELLAHDA